MTNDEAWLSDMLRNDVAYTKGRIDKQEHARRAVEIEAGYESQVAPAVNLRDLTDPAVTGPMKAEARADAVASLARSKG